MLCVLSQVRLVWQASISPACSSCSSLSSSSLLFPFFLASRWSCYPSSSSPEPGDPVSYFRFRVPLAACLPTASHVHSHRENKANKLYLVPPVHQVCSALLLLPQRIHISDSRGVPAHQNCSLFRSRSPASASSSRRVDKHSRSVFAVAR